MPTPYWCRSRIAYRNEQPTCRQEEPTFPRTSDHQRSSSIPRDRTDMAWRDLVLSAGSRKIKIAARGSWASPDTRRLRTQRPPSPLPRGTTPQRARNSVLAIPDRGRITVAYYFSQHPHDPSRPPLSPYPCVHGQRCVGVPAAQRPTTHPPP